MIASSAVHVESLDGCRMFRKFVERHVEKVRQSRLHGFKVSVPGGRQPLDLSQGLCQLGLLLLASITSP